MVTPGQLSRRGQLFEQLAAMIAAGVPLVKALELTAKNRSTGVPRKALLDLLQHLQDGHTFTDSMQLLSGQKRAADGSRTRGNKAWWLTEFDIALLSVGEESGRMDSCFKTLGRYYATQAKIIQETLAKLIITFVTLQVALLVFPVSFLVAFVLGIVNNNYVLCLPFIIEKIVAFGVLYGFIYVTMFATQSNRNAGWRALLEDVYSITPWLGKALKHLCLARLAMTLEALTNAGVDPVRSWELAASACGSQRLKRQILARTPQLQQGVTPSEMVNQISYFPEMFANLYNSAELSGSQDDALQRLHVYYEDDGVRRLQTFAVLLNLFIYLLIAGIIGYNIIQFYVGYFNAALNGQ